MSIEDLLNTYGTSYDAIRLAIGDEVEQLWLELGGPDEQRALAFAEAAVDTINAATTDTAVLVDAYIAEYVSTVTGTPVGAAGIDAAGNGLDLSRYLIDELRNVPGLDVYRRPAVELRRLLAAGKPYEIANAQAGDRAGRMAEGDVGLAHRKAATDSMSREPAVDGYRRTLTGASCTLCMIASTQRYHSAELMPIHTRCDCRVAPIVAGTDYGRVVNRELYTELKRSGAIDRHSAGRKRTAETVTARRAKAAAERQAALDRREQLRLELAGEPNPGRQGRLEVRIDNANEAVRRAEADLAVLETVPTGRRPGALRPGQTIPERPLPIAEAERRYVEANGGPTALAYLDARRELAAAAKRLEVDLGPGIARRTAPAPAIRQHAEMGPVLVDERHAYTAVAPSHAAEHRLELDADRLRSTPAPPPAKVTTKQPKPPAVEAPAPPPLGTTTPPAKPPRYSADSPEVLRYAGRKNIAPNRAAEILNGKAERRAAEAAATRAEAKALSVDHPDVIRVAEANGVSADEVLVARARLRDVRRVIAEEATKVQADAFATLDHWDARQVARPPLKTARSGMGATLRRGEYDWLEKVSARERARLSRQFYTDQRLYAPDQIAESISHVLGRDVGVDEAMDLWLEQTRTYEAAGALRRGKLPSLDAYSGRIDVDSLLPGVSGDRYQVSKVIGVDDLEAAGHIAAVDRAQLADEALHYLGDAANPQLGPSPYHMSFQSWEEEVRDLEYGLRNYPDELPADAADRLAELVPYNLDEPGTTYEELYTRIVTTAHNAGEKVPEYARIPWSD